MQKCRHVLVLAGLLLGFFCTGVRGAQAPAVGDMVPLDLARGKTAVASSNQGEEHLPSMAVDGDGDTRWCAADGSAPQWLQIDLGKPENLVSCRIVWEKDRQDYGYTIDGSADAKSWKTLSDQRHAATGPQAREHKLANANGIRYVRLNVTQLPPGCWASVFDFEVFGTKLVKASEQPKVKRAGTDMARAASHLKPPRGFDLTVFAAPPDVAYVTCVAAAPVGPVFIGIDEDGSLGRKPGKGRIVRAVDSKGTGVADQFTLFATVDHPRGMVWDDGKLYVLHPPFLTVYYEDPKTHTASRSEDLVTGISNVPMLASRGADHTTNGIRMGVDGWIYIATGDYGCYPKAVGKDGTELKFHGGGILRVRPDGSGLEIYSWGHRNIYDVAIDPFMNVLTRDNTNDGDNWNDRLAYIVPTGYYGYPSRFMHFPDEFIDCLADYGGGAPCGSLFLDEPGLPHGLFTVEWGNGQIDHHPLTAIGANFKAGFEKWMDLPRGTDLDVDGQSRLYASSWANGGFDYSGPNVGYIVRLTPKGYKGPPFPDLRKADDAHLLTYLDSPSAVRRLATQREMLRRGDNPALDKGLLQLISSSDPLASRVAAVFTYRLLHGEAANAALVEIASSNAELREFALRAMLDKKNDAAVPAKPFIDALEDSNPRVRLTAAWGLGRLGHAEAAAALLPLTTDADFLVSHVATNALVTLHAVDVCLNAVEPSNSPQLTAGGLGVLKQIHDKKVVDGLIARIPKLQDLAVRSQAYAALCRLCYREADWDGTWWSTRPDTSGPYYKNAEWAETNTVKDALRAALSSEKPQVVRGLIVELEKHKIALPELPALVAKAAATDPEFQKILVDMLSKANRKLLPEQVNELHAIAMSEKAQPALRATAIRALVHDARDSAALDAAVDALAPMLNAAKPAADLTTALDEFIRDPQFSRRIPYFTKLGESPSVQKRELAYCVLMNLASSRLVRAASRSAAARAVDAGWTNSSNAAPMLDAVARVHADAYKDKVAALMSDPHPDVVRAAGAAADALGLRHGQMPAGQLIETMKYDDVVAAVKKDKGDAALGKELFQRQGCIACHTISPSEPPKGPMLGGIGGRYNRAELCESIMKPSAKIAQGFETQWFKTKDGDVIEGFVSHESADALEVRVPAGVATQVKKSDIVARGKRDTSMMPEGLVVKLTPHDLASLIAYLESTKSK